MGIGQKRSHESKMCRDGRIVLSTAGWVTLKGWMWFTLKGIFGVVYCHICGFPVWRYEDFEPDHVIPRGLGGGTRDDRFLKPSHRWCNRDKGSRRTTEAYKPVPKKPAVEREETT